MRVLVTGAAGFVGEHLRIRLHAQAEHDVVAVDHSSWACLPELIRGADAVVHLAGVNRASPDEVTRGNVSLARDVANAVRGAGSAPLIVYANSIQSGDPTPYGAGKQQAAELLADAADDVGSALVDVRLPHLFGEGGRPAYNSFVATFVQCAVDGSTPSVLDRPVEVLHAQDAAQVLIDALEQRTSTSLVPAGTPTTVQSVWDRISAANARYEHSDIPPLGSQLDVDLFNTVRAARFPSRYPMPLNSHGDQRGTLTEVVRAHDGQSQVFVSTTAPGATRGEHFHLRKVERFVVLGGQARISLRKVLRSDVVSFDVDGSTPVVVDMPTLWAHNITNTGTTELTTLFWAHGLFDPADPDTYPERVARSYGAER